MKKSEWIQKKKDQKAKKLNKTPKVNKSFSEITSNANREALKPFIEQRIEAWGRNIFQAMYNLSASDNQRLEALKNLVEKYTPATDEEWKFGLWDIEDSEHNLKIKNGEAEKGDKIRFVFEVRRKDEILSQETFKVINKLMEDRDQQSLPEIIESGIVGMENETAKDITLNPEEEEDKQLIFKVKLQRISKYPDKPTQEEPIQPVEEIGEEDLGPEGEAA